MLEAMKEQVAPALAALTEQERQVIEWSFGFVGSGPCTDPEIAGWLGMTDDMVRRIRLGAMWKIRTYLEVHA